MKDPTPQSRFVRAMIFAIAGGSFLRFGIVGIMQGSFLYGRHDPVAVTSASDPLNFWVGSLVTCGFGVVGLVVAVRDLWSLYRQHVRRKTGTPFPPSPPA